MGQGAAERYLHEHLGGSVRCRLKLVLIREGDLELSSEIKRGRRWHAKAEFACRALRRLGRARAEIELRHRGRRRRIGARATQPELGHNGC